MARRRQHTEPSHPLGAPTVVGLDGGRELARRQQAHRRRANTVKNGIAALIGLAVLGGAAYVGWGVYQDEREREAELRQQNQQNLSPREAIDVLENEPRWNGPGAPAFGVGGDEQPADAIVVTEP